MSTAEQLYSYSKKLRQWNDYTLSLILGFFIGVATLLIASPLRVIALLSGLGLSF